MKIVVTTTQNMAGEVEKKIQSITIAPFDTGIKSIIENKGDLPVGISAGNLDNLPVGTDGDVLIADHLEATGVKWGPSPSAGGALSLYNNDGVTHDLGTVVIVDPTVDYGVKKTTSAGDPKVFAVATEAVSSAASGLYAQTGECLVLVQGNVSRGDWLACSSTSGRAYSVGKLKPTSGGIGIALTAYAGGGAGTVTATISIQFSSTSPLQKLATQSSIASNTTLSHTTDVGTDLLIVFIRTGSSTYPAGVTFNSAAMTLIDAMASQTNYISAWYLKSPSIGTYNIVWAGAGDALARNYSGSMASPIRAASKTNVAPGSSISLTPASAVNDIVVDGIKCDIATWAITGGTQTDEGGAVGFMRCSRAPGAAGTTTMSWAGVSGYECLLTFAIAGS